MSEKISNKILLSVKEAEVWKTYREDTTDRREQEKVNSFVILEKL
jgi:hypothetical protein